jgi:N-acetylmuramoyl-L-alanine amidase
MATSRYGNSKQTSTPIPLIEFARANLPLVLFLFLSIMGMFVIYLRFSPTTGDATLVAEVIEGGVELNAPLIKLIGSRPVRQRMVQSPGPVRIALIAGHMDSDSGAVCADGLTEAQVNLNIAQRVQKLLLNAGIPVEIFAEFDPRLQGYAGTAVISIHADSCEYYTDTATGFKLAGSNVTDSATLSICMQLAYGEITGMSYHADTITPHMTNYHVFRLIAPGTEAIILETGFMNLDRELLTTGADIPAQAIVEGIQCFLKG